MFRITSHSRFPSLTFLRQFSGQTVIKEGDVVLLRRKRETTGAPILTLPLRRDRTISANRRLELKGSIPESTIIGKRVRDYVASTKGDQYRIHQPSLPEYVVLSPRLVTPIYPKEAALIVDLLDIHVPLSDDERLEIFEAGTGHGSLTLYLSRAIHAANSRPPNIPPAPLEKKYRLPREVKSGAVEQDGACPEQQIGEAGEPKVSAEESVAFADESIDAAEALLSADESVAPADEQPITVATAPVPDIHLSRADHEELMGYTREMRAEYEQWLPTRRAIIQTLDIAPGNSAHAQRIVRGFRQGCYYPNINFHVGTIPEYISQRLEEEKEPFLQYAVLDLPDADTHMKLLSKALKPNGTLLLYSPSITQINESFERVMRQKLPFWLDTVMEIGGSSGSGGREWTVKMAKPRALIKSEAEAERAGKEADAANAESDQETPAESENDKEVDLTGWNMVCHPKPGVRTNVGAFVAVYRKKLQ